MKRSICSSHWSTPWFAGCAAVLLVLFLAGCSAASRVQVESYTDASLPPTVGPIPVFQDEDAVPRDFEDRGRLVLPGLASDGPKAREVFLQEARKLGADAIIMGEPERKVFFDAEGYRETYEYSAIAIGYVD